MTERGRVRIAVACATGLAILAQAGCAYVTAVPVRPGSKVQGIRIYDVKPLLIVDGKSTQIQMVPNYNRAYALQFGAFLAKNNVQTTMTNGVLSQVNADMDSTEFIKFLSDLLKTVNPGASLSQTGAPRPSGGVEDRFQVYDIVFNDDGDLVRLRPLIDDRDLRHLKTGSGSVSAAADATITAQPSTNGVNTGKVED